MYTDINYIYHSTGCFAIEQRILSEYQSTNSSPKSLHALLQSIRGLVMPRIAIRTVLSPRPSIWLTFAVHLFCGSKMLLEAITSLGTVKRSSLPTRSRATPCSLDAEYLFQLRLFFFLVQVFSNDKFCRKCAKQWRYRLAISSPLTGAAVEDDGCQAALPPPASTHFQSHTINNRHTW